MTMLGANSARVPFVWAYAGGELSPIFCFAGYLVLVFGLAWWSARRRQQAESFVNEYYLGGRQLGVWALALTFAATAASGGTFVGFPALIYEHGWVLALWIGGYMMVPLVGMGLLGRRLNRVARVSDAVTLPEIFGKRLASPWTGGVATALIAFFMFWYLVAQFKAGSKILASLLGGSPWFWQASLKVQAAMDAVPWLQGLEGDYVLCLSLFALVVIAYVAYGGFRAVVWTDVMQGLLMFFGVAVLLILVLQQTGGLGKATRKLERLTPPDIGSVRVVRDTGRAEREQGLAKGAWVHGVEGAFIRLAEPVLFQPGAVRSEPVQAIFLTSPEDIERVRAQAVPEFTAETESRRDYAFGAGEPGVYLTAPGPDASNTGGFLGLMLAFSFFVFWPFGTAAQPSNMVRLMAFRNPRVLWHALIAVAFYFSLIYFSLVVIFCCGRVLMPGMAIDPDQTMPALAAQTTSSAGVPWLAGILLAAPFAAVMSSVDSFLLVASSSLVRDVYQRLIHPTASERRVRRLSYFATIGVGAAAFAASLNPPEYLQHVIVFASAGVAASFLIPMVATLFWKRLTAWGAIAGMLGGCFTHLILHFNDWRPLGLDPFLWDQGGSALALIVVTLLTSPPDEASLRKYFGEELR